MFARFARFRAGACLGVPVGALAGNAVEYGVLMFSLRLAFRVACAAAARSLSLAGILRVCSLASGAAASRLRGAVL